MKSSDFAPAARCAGGRREPGGVGNRSPRGGDREDLGKSDVCRDRRAGRGLAQHRATALSTSHRTVASTTGAAMLAMLCEHFVLAGIMFMIPGVKIILLTSIVLVFD